MLVDPSLEALLPNASCPYELAVLVSKRASQLVEGAQPMIPDQAANAVSLACREILNKKVVGVEGVLGKDEFTVPITREARLKAEEEKRAREQKESFRRDARAADIASQEAAAANEVAPSPATPEFVEIVEE